MFTVNAKMFEIAHRFASKEESRYYLGGVCIEAAPQGGAYLVATDGHRMMVLHDANALAPAEPVILRGTALALKACREKTAQRIVYNETSGEVVTHEGQSLASGLAVIDGTYPDWRRVVPCETPTGTSAGFSAALMADFAKAATDLAKLSGLRSGSITVHQSGEGSPALVYFTETPGFGLFCPMHRYTGAAQSESVWQSIHRPAAEYAVAAE
jgi:hypothetical protein